MNRTTSDLMFLRHRLRAFLLRSIFSHPSPIPKCHLLLQLKPYPSTSPLSLFSTTTTRDSDKQSFTVSYFINNCGFSPETAAKAAKRVRFGTAKKPDSVIAFFVNHGFSIAQIHSIIRREPELLVCNPAKRVLPKFQFLASKGASTSDTVAIVTGSSYFLRQSLQNHIKPAFEAITRFSPSESESDIVITTVTKTPRLLRMSLDQIPLYFSAPFDSDKQSFTVSYLTNNCGFSPQAAAKASKRIRFSTAKKPDSFIAFLINHGFSISQIHAIIRRVPELLVCNPTKRVLPKFQFLASKGASASDIVTTVTKSPSFLLKSLQNHLIPAFEFVRTLCPSDEKAINCALLGYNCVSIHHMKSKVKLLLDMGVSPSNIYILLATWPSMLRYADLKEAVEEVKGLGFHPSRVPFILALRAKRAVSKSLWDAKVDAFKTWGWSEDAVLEAFRKDPNIMLFSIEKVNAVMSFWVGHLGWDPSVLLARPKLFSLSLEKRLMPRASVLKYLFSRGLIKKDTGLTTPFMLSEKLFLQRFVRRFEEQETSKLLSLYQGGR